MLFYESERNRDSTNRFHPVPDDSLATNLNACLDMDSSVSMASPIALVGMGLKEAHGVKKTAKTLVFSL